MSESYQFVTQSDADGLSIGPGAVGARDGSVAIGPASSGGKNLYNSVDLSGTLGNVTLNSGLDDESLASLTETLGESGRQSADAIKALAQKQQEQIGTLAKNVQSGDSETNKLILGGVAALALVILGVILWKK